MVNNKPLSGVSHKPTPPSSNVKHTREVDKKLCPSSQASKLFLYLDDFTTHFRDTAVFAYNRRIMDQIVTTADRLLEKGET